MSEKDKIRNAVSETYAQAVAEPSEGGCCAGPAPKGVAAAVAGYDRTELNDLPAEAVTNSFGCGNPVALGELKEGDVVLDLGSGAGIDILLAAKKVGPRGRAIGIDMTDAMLAKARENIDAAGLTNVEVRKGIIEDLPVEDASVDWVISNCVINLSPEKSRVFSEIARVLKPGGRMLVADIVASDLPEWVRSSDALYASCVAGAISEAEYVSGLERAGLAEVTVRDRLVYEKSQLGALYDSEIGDGKGCCGDKSLVTEEVVETLSGKIWSALVYARKPE